MNLNIRGLTTETAQWLMDHHARIRQCCPFTGSALQLTKKAPMEQA